MHTQDQHPSLQSQRTDAVPAQHGQPQDPPRQPQQDPQQPQQQPGGAQQPDADRPDRQQQQPWQPAQQSQQSQQQQQQQQPSISAGSDPMPQHGAPVDADWPQREAAGEFSESSQPEPAPRDERSIADAAAQDDDRPMRDTAAGHSQDA